MIVVENFPTLPKDLSVIPFWPLLPMARLLCKAAAFTPRRRAIENANMVVIKEGTSKDSDGDGVATNQ